MASMLNRISILEDDQGSGVTADTSDSLIVRSSSNEEVGTSSDLDGLVIDKVSYAVYLDGERKTLPKKEFELLLLLASNPNKVFRRDFILSEVWGPQYRKKDSRSLDVHIRMIRKKLNERFITTIRGVGYKLAKNGH
jgi:two-component system alkaline phosphatase synthesis response regulator PhoP